MDFTFQSENVYGIPMHATDLSLKTTTYTLFKDEDISN
jgi:hypothetical protein